MNSILKMMIPALALNLSAIGLYHFFFGRRALMQEVVYVACSNSSCLDITDNGKMVALTLQGDEFDSSTDIVYHHSNYNLQLTRADGKPFDGTLLFEHGELSARNGVVCLYSCVDSTTGRLNVFFTDCESGREETLHGCVRMHSPGVVFKRKSFSV